ncbi:hypothetical protein JCM11251_000989 [Rhodosporidiobolus azoricus]
MPRAAAAPPTPQEIERKLGSPTMPAPPGPSLSTSLESVDLQRRLSSASRRAPSMSSGDEGDETSPPLRPTAQLSAISEAEDALASGSESDASSLNDGARRASRPDPRDILRLDPSRASRDSGGLSENVALKSGYLMKKGEKRKTWKKRWFVLRGGQLMMYKTDKEYRLLRLIPIPDIHSVSPVELKKHPHAFGIVTPQRTYYVEATSTAEVHSWCELINRAKADYVARATTTSIDTPTSGPGTEQPTPMGPSPTQTPKQEAYRPDVSMAIPIPAAATQGGQRQQPPPGSSYATTTSGFTPSSYNSTASSSLAPAVPSAPPNSLVNPPLTSAPAAGNGLGFNTSDLELQSLDAGISQLSLGSAPSSSAGERGVPQRSSSGMSDTLALPPGIGGVGAQPSPGVVSSSEDEDGFEAYEQQFGSPGSFSALGPQQPAQQLQFEQQQQQQYFASPASDPPAPIASPPDPNKVILAGYLMKQGKRKNWRKRWFVLHSGVLMYSRSHMDTKFHRQIPLTSIIDAIEYDPSAHPSGAKRTNPLSPSSPTGNPSLPGVGDSSRSYEHCFKIITPKRTYLCCAPSEEDEIKWLAALQCLVARRTQAAAMGASASAGPLTPSAPPTAAALAPPVPAAAASKTSSTPGDTTPTPKRTLSQSTTAPPPASRPVHGRQRSVTDAARQAVKDVERRYRPQMQQPPTGHGMASGSGVGAQA